MQIPQTVVAVDASPAAERIQTATHDSPQQMAVLVVHQAALTRLGLVALLRGQRRFHLCGETDSARCGRQLLVERQPDVAVLGLTLPDGDGIELIKEFRKLRPATRVLVLSARGDALSVQRAFRAGARGYVLTHDPSIEITLALGRVSAGELHASRSIAPFMLENLSRLAPHGGSSRAQVEHLSDRELHIFRRIGAGHGPTQMARDLHISVKTVETHQAHLKEKLGCKSCADLSAHAARWLLAMASRSRHR